MKSGATIDVLREKYIHGGSIQERLIIPATHIKGILRSEAERIWGNSERIDDLFGREKQEGASGYREPVLKFTDARNIRSIMTERMHVRIDRSTGSHDNRGLFSQKVVANDSRFIGFILSRKALTEEDMKILRGCILSASHCGLGGSRSSGLGGVIIGLQPSSIKELREEMMM